MNLQGDYASSCCCISVKNLHQLGQSFFTAVECIKLAKVFIPSQTSATISPRQWWICFFSHYGYDPTKFRKLVNWNFIQANNEVETIKVSPKLTVRNSCQEDF